MGAVVGRDEELDKIRAHLLGPDGLPARCQIVGEAGSGKTTVWRAIVDDARSRGHQVLAASGSQAEWPLSLGTARDLVVDAMEAIEHDLPPPQRRLLRIMLLLDEPDAQPADPGTLAVAFRSLIRANAARGPLLIAVDDVQWMDPASVSLLTYALRRLSVEPVGVLLARRDGPPGGGDALTSADVDRDLLIHLGPLTLGALGAVLRDNLAVPIARPTLRRIHAVAGGNPLFAIELGRVLTDPAVLHPPGAPLVIPASVADLVRARLEGLDHRALEALGILAALDSPDISVLEFVLEHDAMAALAPAFDAGIVDLTGDGVRFHHPLVASIAYGLLGPVRRREIHRRIGDLLVDPEERAHHTALGVERADEAAAAIVEEGATVALRRGSPAAAADLAFHAGRLTPRDSPGARYRRVLLEIDGAFAAGETARAADRLDAELAVVRPGRDRAELLARRARLHSFANDIASSIDGLQEALSEAGDDDTLRRGIEEGLAWGLMLVRRDLASALAHARSAVAHARRIGNPAALAESLATQALAECLTGQPWLATITGALALEPTVGLLPATRRPGFAHGCCLTCVGDLDGARTVFEGLASDAIANGDDALLPSILNRLARVELQTARWEVASAHLDEGLGRATESGHRPSIASLLGKRAVVAAFRGDHDQARVDAGQALELAAGSGFDPAVPERAVARGGESALWALGHVALVEGRPERAVDLLEPMTMFLVDAGVIEPGEMPWLADLGESLLLTQRHDVARIVLQLFERVARTPDREADVATTDYLRALVDTANGDHAVARDRLIAARARHDRLDRPFEAARTDLALGGVQRRLRERRAARASLERAREVFVRLGSIAWAERTTAELARVGGRAPAGDGLTPTERAVAELVARGHTNRETAAALFLSVNTVEAALTAVYGKLGIRSRTELARRIDESPEVIS